MTKAITFIFDAKHVADAKAIAKLSGHDFGAKAHMPTTHGRMRKALGVADGYADKAFQAMSGGIVVALAKKFPNGFTKKEAMLSLADKDVYKAADEVKIYQRIVSALNNAIHMAQGNALLPSQNKVKDLVDPVTGASRAPKEPKAKASRKPRPNADGVDLTQGTTSEEMVALMTEGAVKPKASQYEKLSKPVLAGQVTSLVAFSNVFAKCETPAEFALAVADFHATCGEINAVKA